MKKPKEHANSIRESLVDSPDCGSRFLWSAKNNTSLSEALLGTSLGGRASEPAGRSVLIAARDQLSAARVIIELDGSARRLVICPPDVSLVDIPGIIEQAEVDAIVVDISLPHGEAVARSAGVVRSAPYSADCSYCFARCCRQIGRDRSIGDRMDPAHFRNQRSAQNGCS